MNIYIYMNNIKSNSIITKHHKQTQRAMKSYYRPAKRK